MSSVLMMTDQDMLALPSPALAWDDETSPTRRLRAITDTSTPLLEDAPRYNTPPALLTTPLDQEARSLLDALITPAQSPDPSPPEVEMLAATPLREAAIVERVAPALPLPPGPPVFFLPSAAIAAPLAEPPCPARELTEDDQMWAATIREHGMTMFRADPRDNPKTTRPLLDQAALWRDEVRKLRLQRELQERLAQIASLNAQIQEMCGSAAPGSSIYGA